MERDVLYAKQRFQDYFARIVALSQSAPPPGTNAASGWFREHMVHDPIIAQCGASPTLALTGDGAGLFEGYQKFYSVAQKTFSECGNVWGSGAGNLPPFIDNVRFFLGDIVTIGLAIINLMSGDQQTKDHAKESLANGITSLCDTLKRHGPVWNGSHANGWISVHVQSAAVWSRDLLASKNFQPNSGAQQVSEILRTVFDSIAQLETKGHDPWLKAEWQVRFQAILTAGVMSLQSLG